MKKLFLILLTVISLVNVNNAFASSEKERVISGMQKGFAFLVQTRDESLLNPETIKKKRKMEDLVVRTYNSNSRNLLMQAYDAEVEGFRNLYNEHKKNRDGKEHKFLECLNELGRIKVFMESNSK